MKTIESTRPGKSTSTGEAESKIADIDIPPEDLWGIPAPDCPLRQLATTPLDLTDLESPPAPREDQFGFIRFLILLACVAANTALLTFLVSGMQP